MRARIVISSARGSRVCLVCWRRTRSALGAGPAGRVHPRRRLRARRPGRKRPTGCSASCRSRPERARGVVVDLARIARLGAAGPVRRPAGLDALPWVTASAGWSPAQWSRSHRARRADHPRHAQSRRPDRQSHQRVGRASTPRCSTPSATSSTGWATVSYDQWWWVYSAVEGALNWGGYHRRLLDPSPARRDGHAVRRAVRAGGLRRLAVPR